MDEISFTPFPTLETKHLILRQLTIEDLNEIFILKSDERLLKGYNAKAKTYEEARQFIQKRNDEILRNESIYWGISLKGENIIIGSICLWNIAKEQSKAEVGYELMFDQQGKGIITEALRAIVGYGFDIMKLDLIEAVPYSENIRSTKLLERNGFIRRESFIEADSSKEMIIYECRNTKVCCDTIVEKYEL